MSPGSLEDLRALSSGTRAILEHLTRGSTMQDEIDKHFQDVEFRLKADQSKEKKSLNFEQLNLLELHYILRKTFPDDSDVSLANTNFARLSRQQVMYRKDTNPPSGTEIDHAFASSFITIILGLLANYGSVKHYNVIYMVLVLNCYDNFQAIPKKDNSDK